MFEPSQGLSHQVRVAALAVVHDDSGRVLLVRSAKRAERWELPGGQLEAGESPMEACRREVLEETGVDIGELQFVGLYYGSGDGLIRITFAADALHTDMRSTESHYAADILESAWFDVDDLPHPMPVLARRMILTATSRREELATVVDDSEVE